VSGPYGTPVHTPEIYIRHNDAARFIQQAYAWIFTCDVDFAVRCYSRWLLRLKARRGYKRQEK